MVTIKWTTKECLYDLYVNQKMTQGEIAKVLQKVDHELVWLCGISIFRYVKIIEKRIGYFPVVSVVRVLLKEHTERSIVVSGVSRMQKMLTARCIILT